MQKYVSTRSFSAVPKGDAMVDALGNPVKTAEVDIQTMTTVPLPWTPGAVGVHGRRRRRSSTTAAGLRKVLYVLFLP